MGIKVKKKLFLKDLPKEINKRFARSLKNDIADEIVSEILQGKSPVRGHKFIQYSKSYSKVKGRKAPVDMLKEGKLLESLMVKQDKKGRVEIFFKDKKAIWHQQGKGSLPVRKLLPAKKGELFNLKLTRIINKILEKAVKKAAKKQ